GLYKGKVDINITGKESKEVYLKVTFANPSGQILNVPLTLNDDAKYGTQPFYKTSPTDATGGSNATYIPLILNRDANTLSLNIPDAGLAIFGVEVVYKTVNRY
ncbi:MAG: hypothetical protein IJU41_06680, partial [Clostridia bacterium]|nr:hypothetical protein [Clostridia bacterium]MBQ9429212.1 hypothetical protein [Clostridia bacterium]